MDHLRPPLKDDRLLNDVRRALGHIKKGEPEKAQGLLEKAINERKGVK